MACHLVDHQRISVNGRVHKVKTAVVAMVLLCAALMSANYMPLSQIVAAEATECQPISEPARPVDRGTTWLTSTCASRTFFAGLLPNS